MISSHPWAAKLLSETDLPIASVSDESGFSQYYYFAKVFRKTMGVTPANTGTRMQGDESERGYCTDVSGICDQSLAKLQNLTIIFSYEQHAGKKNKAA